MKIVKIRLDQSNCRILKLRTIYNLSVTLALSFSSCVSTPDDVAAKNPANNVCPRFGMLKISEISPQESIINNEEIAVKTIDEGIKIFPIKYFINALQIDEQQELNKYYSIYQRVCGKGLIPPFEKEIAFNKNLKSLELKIIEDERKANEKMLGRIPISQVLDLSDTQKLTDFELFHFHQSKNPGIYYAFTQGGLDGNEFEIRNRMKEVEYIGNFQYIKFSSSSDSFKLYDYNFKAGGFDIRDYRVYWYESGFDKYHYSDLFIKISENEAPKIRLASQNASLTLNILAKPKFIISNETVYKCGEGQYWWHLNQEKYEYIITQKPHLISACSKLKVKIKSMKYEIVNFNLVDNSSGEIYWK